VSAREQLVDLMLKTLREAAEPLGTMRADCFLLLDALLSNEGRLLLWTLMGTPDVPDAPGGERQMQFVFEDPGKGVT